MICLIALDIDGTLIPPGVGYDALPDAAMTAVIHDLHDAGVIVVLASGRMFPGTLRVAEHLRVDQPLVCQQGSSIHDCNGYLRHGHAIDEDIAAELFEFADQRNWPLAWFDSVRYLVTKHCAEAQFFADVSGVEMEIHTHPHRSGVRATGIDIISGRQHALEVHRVIEQRYGERVSLLDFSSVTAVHAPLANKGNALKSLAQEFGIDREQVLAIGDSVNDVSMLAWAGESAAPRHCDDHARAAAKEILPGQGVDGVVARLRSVLER